ncbi:hypothetical protein C7W93_10145 [Glaciimonas sp. PCH181]|nr:hypothetical protein C7W93_10145 [Glaciimonas sp. PCH181]
MLTMVVTSPAQATQIRESTITTGEINTITLFDIPDDIARLLEVHQLSGPPLQTTIKNGDVYVLAQEADNGREAELSLNGNGHHYTLPLRIETRRYIGPARLTEVPSSMKGEAPVPHDERAFWLENGYTDEELDSDEQQVFYPEAYATLEGLSPGHLWTPDVTEISITLHNAPVLSMRKEDTNIQILNDRVFNQFFFEYFDYDPKRNRLTTKPEKFKEFYDRLPGDPLTLTLNGDDAKGQFAGHFNFIFQKASAHVTGRLLDEAGYTLTNLSDRQVSISGLESDIRQLSTVDVNGEFIFPLLPADEYTLSLVDFNHPTQQKPDYSLIIGEDSGDIHVDLVLPQALTGPVTYKGKPIESSTRGNTGGILKVIQEERDEQERRARNASRQAAPQCTRAADGSTIMAVGGKQNVPSICTIAYQVPQGVASVQIDVTVQSDEALYWTGRQSPFNDYWAYELHGLPENWSASGNVNNTHVGRTEITRSQCINISPQTRDGPLSITGKLTTTNIGGEIRPTRVSARFKNGCGDIRITEITAKTENAKKHKIFHPRKIGTNELTNRRGSYISLPHAGTAASHAAWGFPVDIKYEPEDAVIEAVHAQIVLNDNIFTLPGNLIDQASTTTAGEINFADLKLPTASLPPGCNPVQIQFMLKGKNGDNAGESNFMAMKASGIKNFKPLYLAATIAPHLTRRRYGMRDLGGDAWAMAGTINWLLSKPFYFDDISGLHIPQNGKNNSALGHTGHSDGQQIDLRYDDGTGNYTGALNGQGDGAAIKKLAIAAKKEVTTNLEAKLNLEKLRNWIARNRAMLTTEANAPHVRVVYIGVTWMDNLISKGQFSDSTPIPGVPAWKKPTTLSKANLHYSHWHMSLIADAFCR